MLTFLIFSLLAILAGNFMLRIFFEMIQPEQALDIVFHWQNMLNKLYGGKPWQQLLGKALGDCERCVSFWFMPLWFVAYYFICTHVVKWWISWPADTLSTKILVNVVWYCMFHSIGATTGFLLLLKRKKDVL